MGLKPDRNTVSRRQGYARFLCRRCPEPARFWREGGYAALDKHAFTYHPGQSVDGEVKTFDHPAPGHVLYGGGKQ